MHLRNAVYDRFFFFCHFSSKEHPQLGPELTSADSGKRDTMLRKHSRSRSGRSSLFKTIERETLLSLRRYAYNPCASVIGDLKALGILKYRGRRGGKQAKLNASLERQPKSIEVVESRRPSKTYKQRFEHGNLICIPRYNNSTRVSHPALNLQFRSASSPTSAVWQNPKIDYGLRSLSSCILTTKILTFAWSRKLISRLICRTL